MPEQNLPWYQGITGYQWLVLTIASLGWVFDVFEGQIFVASMNEAMPELLGAVAGDKLVLKWNDLAFASFLLGGAFGGVLFGVISDKIGRSTTMIVTILFYSLFTCVTAFAQEAWHMVALRFLVAMGVGGEWAVATAMVAEVMPKRSRPIMSSIFHGSSVFGTLLAAAAGAFIVGNPALGDSAWRWGFAIGVIPACLTLFVRWKLKEPPQWVRAREQAAADRQQRPGQLLHLFGRDHLRNTFVGVSLASIGLVTFWGGHIYGKNALLRHAQQRILAEEGVAGDASKEARQDAFARHKPELKRAEMLSMVLNTIGGGLGLVLFGTISNRIGRRGAFVFYHAVAFVMMVLLFMVLVPNNASAVVLAIALPIFGFFTLGMHAGYAVYFPELYPTRLRGTGTGFCFNTGRLATAAAFIFFAYLPKLLENDALMLSATLKDLMLTPESKALMLSPLYLLGCAIVLLGRETRDEELPE